jgi:hypothetical protein
MMNKMLIGVIAIALALIGTGCDSSSNNTSLEKPYVTTAAAADGGTLHLTWNAVEGAESYEITAGDSVYTTAADSFDVSVPAATVEVRAVKGSSKSDPATISCKVVESAVEFFADLSSTHADGFGFDGNGGVAACTLNVYPGQQSMDFYADSTADGIRLVRAIVTQSALGNAVKAASGSYDAATMADPFGGTYSSALVVMVDSTYYLRISADTTNTWSTSDNFAKVRVDSIVGTKVSLTTAYQKIAGLRWLGK